MVKNFKILPILIKLTGIIFDIYIFSEGSLSEKVLTYEAAIELYSLYIRARRERMKYGKREKEKRLKQAKKKIKEQRM